jgi:hypothetical protein
MFYPMDTVAVDARAATAMVGANAAASLARGEIVLSRTSAQNEGAEVGDTMVLSGWNGSSHTFTVGSVVDDRAAADAELVVDEGVGTSMGVTRPTQVRFFGTRRQLLDTVAALPSGIRSDASWLPSPVEAVSQARFKHLLGEFAYKRSGNGDLTLDPAWTSANLVVKAFPLIGTITCHRVVAAAAIAALDEIEHAGLSRLIHTKDTYQNGGCFGARDQKLVDGTSGHTLSRHAWGGAIDINPAANPQGGKPSMDHRVVDIFRKHGFAWGGTFPTPDGMHFEYIGA